MRSLWQILVAFKERNLSAGLTCDECFRYMEHIAEEALAGAEQDPLLEAVHALNSIYPHCREHHLNKLDAMEMYIREEHILIKMVKSDSCQHPLTNHHIPG